MEASGFGDVQLVRNERGEKATLLRTLVRYLLIREDKMIDESSLLLGPVSSMTALDKGLFKFLVTGVDGSSVVPVRSSDQLKASRDGKVELLRDMINKLTKNLDPEFDAKIAKLELEKAEAERDALQDFVSEQQAIVDAIRQEHREKQAELRDELAHIAELKAMFARFSELESVYRSDLERLTALEEGGFLLGKFASFECPMCGADPEHQRHSHQLGDVEIQRVAVEAEIAKTERELSDLLDTMGKISIEIEQRSKFHADLCVQSKKIATRLNANFPSERTSRAMFNDALKRFSLLVRQIETHERVADLNDQVAELEAMKLKSRPRAENLNLDVTSSEANEFSKVIKSVLGEWGYPGLESVHFDTTDCDIVVDGKRRRGNGKGIRAILHCAFKVALLLYCRDKSLPHPGFMIMDTPLLAYRGPIGIERYGALEADEEAMQQTQLNSRFYNHLQSLSDISQFIVLENETPPSNLSPGVTKIRFTGNPDFGRKGLF